MILTLQEKIVKKTGKIQKKSNLNSDKEWKIPKKSKLNSEMVWKILKKIEKKYAKYRRKVS
jgi:hypothetical protein